MVCSIAASPPTKGYARSVSVYDARNEVIEQRNYDTAGRPTGGISGIASFSHISATMPAPGAGHGKVALVTGANTGIGLALCRALAQLGFDVYLGARDVVQRLAHACRHGLVAHDTLTERRVSRAKHRRKQEGARQGDPA